MTPFYFGTRARRLFGIYSPSRKSAGRKAAVLCAPFGQEYIRAHRSLRQLAVVLNNAGYHALRFDYFGTGDSAGDMVDASLVGWQDDIGTAIEELRDTSGANRVTLMGMRLGGTLAARVIAGGRRDVDAAVLWDPVASGAAYVAAMIEGASNAVRAKPRPQESGGGHEVLGFPLTAAMARDIDAIRLDLAVAALSTRTLVIASNPQSLAELEALHASALNDKVQLEQIPTDAAWLKSVDGVGALPTPILQRIVQWAGG